MKHSWFAGHSFMRYALLLWAGLMLSACAAVRPQSQIASVVAKHIPAASPVISTPSPSPSPAAAWWRELDDPALNQLVERAMVHNHDIHSALASVRQVRAQWQSVQRDNRPSGGVTISAQESRLSQIEVDPYRQDLPTPPRLRLASLMQSVSWELDIFGRLRTASAMAERETEAAQADYIAATTMVQAEVVRAYVLLRQSQQALLDIAEERQLLERFRDRMQQRVQAGLAEERDVYAATARLAQRAAEAEQLKADVAERQSLLAVLLGLSPLHPDAALSALAIPEALPKAPKTLVLLSPSERLLRRPDVVRADAELRVALGQEVLAARAHLPRLSLTGSVGLNAPWSDLGQSNAMRYAVGPVLQWEWLDAGRRDARKAAAAAGRERAWHQFEQTVLRALHDSESAWRDWQFSSSAVVLAAEAEQAAKQTAWYSAMRRDAGLESPTLWLNAEADFRERRRERYAADTAQLLAYVRVQLALAVWQPATARESTAPVALAAPISSMSGAAL